MIAVVEYTPETAHLMRSDYAARRAKLYAVRKEPEAPAPAPAPAPVVAEPIVLPPAVVHDAVREWLRLATPEAMKPAAHRRIIDIVAEVTGVERMQLLSGRRMADIVRPRQICFYLLKTCTTLSLPLIGRCMGGRDHTTVLHGARKIASLIETDDALRALVASLTSRIQAEAA